MTGSRILGFTVYILLFVASILYTLDLGQENSEELFLSEEGLESYQTFQNQITEHQVLVAQYEKEPIDVADWDALNKLVLAIKEKFPAVLVFNASEVYGSGWDYSSLDTELSFFYKHPQPMLPLLGKNHQVLLLALPKSFEVQQVSDLIDFLKKRKELGIASFSGLPYINHTLNEYADSIRFTIFPLMFLVSFLLSMFICGSFINGLIVFLPSLLATFISLSTIKFFFSSMNMISSIVPLMMSVVNLFSAYHLFYACKSSQSWLEARKKKILPIGLMIVTTAIGFGSLGVSDIAVIRQFAILCASLIFITFSLNIIWFWLCFTLIQKEKNQEPLVYRIFPSRIFATGMSYRSIILVAVASCILAILMGPRIPFLTDATAYFPKGSHLRDSIRRVEKKFMGNPTFDLLLRSKQGNPFSFKELKEISDLEKELTNEFSGEYRILSRNAMVMEGNELYSGQGSLPNNKFAYQNIEGSITPELRQSFPREEAYRIALMGTSLNKDVFEDHKKRIAANKLLQKFNWEFNGLHYQMLEAQNNLIGILFKSFLISLGLISLIAFSYFRNGMVFLVFLMVNMIPVMASIVFMTIANLSINIATVMAFSISLGMIVDSTIHLTYDISNKVPWETFYKTTLIPVVASSILILISFILFGLSDFLPIWQIGVLLSFSISIGFIMDLFVLPTLLLKSKYYDKAL
ncbi:MAG: hypothetical protein HRU09_13765 [Oligoflexales bacterium]|nr:hypothetical protein [Oligoflexales bacterium]